MVGLSYKENERLISGKEERAEKVKADIQSTGIITCCRLGNHG